MNEYYGTVQEATEYFDGQLHKRAWYQAKVSDRPKALATATMLIDTLNFKGRKRTVCELLESNPHATDAEIRAAESAQILEFPRGTDTEVPIDIRIACYEIAHSLLDGKDPELELENLGVSSQGYESVRTTFNRAQLPIEHLINSIPSAIAWRKLRPFLRDGDALKLSRV